MSELSYTAAPNGRGYTNTGFSIMAHYPEGEALVTFLGEKEGNKVTVNAAKIDLANGTTIRFTKPLKIELENDGYTVTPEGRETLDALVGSLKFSRDLVQEGLAQNSCDAIGANQISKDNRRNNGACR